MKTSLLYLACSALWLFACGGLDAQVADVSIPKQRETAVAAAESLAESRKVQVKQAEDTPNPFVWREAAPEKAETSPKSAPIVAPAVGGEELLAQLAARIPATGIAFLGGEGVLLLGQKKLKVGDVITISFEGQDYELSIAGISSASFTVKRGGLLHTRPTQLASPTTRNIRP